MAALTILANAAEGPFDSYLRVAVLGVVALVFGVLPLLIALVLRPKKMGEIKQAAFEC